MKMILTFMLVLLAFSSFSQRGKEEKLPFNEPRYQSDEQFIRISASGMAPLNYDDHKELALSNAELSARARIASQMQVIINESVKRTIEKTTGQASTVIRDTTRRVIEERVQQTLVGSKVIEWKGYKNKKTYEVWVVMEWPKKEFSKGAIEQIRQALPDDIREKMKSEVFEKQFKEELKRN